MVFKPFLRPISPKLLQNYVFLILTPRDVFQEKPTKKIFLMYFCVFFVIFWPILWVFMGRFNVPRGKYCGFFFGGGGGLKGGDRESPGGLMVG